VKFWQSAHITADSCH